MSRGRILLIGLLALVLSVVVTVLVNRELQRRLNLAEAEQGVIVVASEKLPLGTRLEERHLKVAPWPEDVALEGSFRTPSELIGRGVVVPMLVNEPILESKLAPTGAGAGLTSAIPDGMRAVSVKVDDVIGVAGFVLPGSKVDVILTGSPDENRKIEVSKVILENVLVLAAGQNLQQTDGGEAQSVNVVTLLVTPEDSQKLTLASNDGRIQLALRNPLDLEEVDPDAIQKRSLYSKPAPPKPPQRPRVIVRAPEPKEAPPPPPPPAPRTFTVEVIQGSQTEKVNFTEKKDGGNGS